VHYNEQKTRFVQKMYALYYIIKSLGTYKWLEASYNSYKITKNPKNVQTQKFQTIVVGGLDSPVAPKPRVQHDYDMVRSII